MSQVSRYVRAVASAATVAMVCILLTYTPQAANPKQESNTLRRSAARSIAKDARRLPIADGRSVTTQIAASARSSAVVGDARRPEIGLEAWTGTSPGIEICSGTSYDYQHHDDGQRQIATLGDGSLTHFAWMHWDVVPDSLDFIERLVAYNAYSTTSGLLLGDCGVEIQGAGGNPYLARGGYVTIAVGSDDNGHPSFHQRDPDNQDPLSAKLYSSYVLDQAGPGTGTFLDNQLPGSVTDEAIWPHLAIDHGGATKDPGDDVYHVCSRTFASPDSREIYYWRRVGSSTPIWEGPAVLDYTPHISHHVAVDPLGESVSIIYTKDETPGNPNCLYQVVYTESPSNGADWITAGVANFPTPLVDLGFPPTQVTYYSDPYGPQAWSECTGEYDLDGRLHVVWVEQDSANVSSECRIRHWEDQTLVVTTVAEALDFANIGLVGARDLWLAYPQIAFGDGNTQCNGGPSNPGPAGANANRNYIYVTYEQYGGPTVDEGNDVSSSGYQNLDIYLAVSNNGGASWSVPSNLTDTKTPGCDGSIPGSECASEREPSINPIVNDTIHLFYILDTDAGDVVYGQGHWTLSPVMYYRIPGGTDAQYVCPALEPRFVPLLSDGDPDCEYNAPYDPPGTVVEQLTIYNYGTTDLTGTVSVTPPSATWLQLTEGAYAVTPGGPPDVRTVMMDAGDVSITAEGVYSAQIEITHNDPNRPNPGVVPVDFFVFNDFDCPQFLTLNTGCLWLEVSNVERIGYLNNGLSGLSRLAGDSSYSIYDGSLIVGVPPNPDTLVYRNIYGSGNGQPGYRALSNLEIDTSAYGTNAGEATAFAQQTTVDSTIGIDVQYVFPQHPDSCEFVLLMYRIYNRTENDLLDLIVGEAVDFDVMPGVDEADLQTQQQNVGYLRTDFNLIYQTGADTADHVVVGDNTATRFKAGITALQCDVAPRAWIAPNNPWLYQSPGNGFYEGYLYRHMTTTGFELLPAYDPDPAEDLHSVMVAKQGIDLAPGESEYFQFGLVSSNTGTDESDLINTTRKAWRYAFGWSFLKDPEVTDIDFGVPYSIPYTVNGTHEGGLESGCCGCIVEKVEGDHRITINPGPDPCKGTIDFAGGSACCSFSATFRVTDLCETYEDYIVARFYQDGFHCDFFCEYQCDFDNDGFITALDLGAMIDILFAGAESTYYDCCTWQGDFDCDSFVTALDLSGLIDHLFAGGQGPCNPLTDGGCVSDGPWCD